MDRNKQNSYVEFNCSSTGCECGCCCDHKCSHGDTCFGGHANYPELHWYRCDACTPKTFMTLKEAKKKYGSYK